MAERAHAHQLQVHSQQPHRYDPKTLRPGAGGPSAGKVIALVTLLPAGAGLLGLSGVALFFSFIGLLLATPVFIICSPVLVPAFITAGLVLFGLFISGAFGLSGLSGLSWAFQSFRLASEAVPHQLDEAKRRMQDMAATMGQKTKEVGQAIEKKAQEAGK